MLAFLAWQLQVQPNSPWNSQKTFISEFAARPSLYFRHFWALTERHEEPVERRVGVDPPEDDDGGDVADHAEDADDEQRHALDPELHAAHEVAVVLEALVALVGRRAAVGARVRTAV